MLAQYNSRRCRIDLLHCKRIDQFCSNMPRLHCTVMTRLGHNYRGGIHSIPASSARLEKLGIKNNVETLNRVYACTIASMAPGFVISSHEAKAQFAPLQAFLYFEDRF